MLLPAASCPSSELKHARLTHREKEGNASMNSSIQLKKRVSPARNSVSHSLSLITFHYSLLTVLLLALGPAPKAFGVSPAPDGGYPGANTAEGDNALQSLSSGIHNTALGNQALFSLTTGNFNMANGSHALFSNTTGSVNTANGYAALALNTTGHDNAADGSQ